MAVSPWLPSPYIYLPMRRMSLNTQNLLIRSRAYTIWVMRKAVQT
jgi:hypothetical protein